MDEFWSPLFCVDGNDMHIFFNFSRKERIIAYYQPYTGANSLLLGGVFSHDTMDKVGTNISVAYSSNLHACGIKALVFFSYYHHRKEIFSLLQKLRYL